MEIGFFFLQDIGMVVEQPCAVLQLYSWKVHHCYIIEI